MLSSYEFQEILCDLLYFHVGIQFNHFAFYTGHTSHFKLSIYMLPPMWETRKCKKLTSQHNHPLLRRFRLTR